MFSNTYCGVSQGSILGPVMCNVYIAEFTHIILVDWALRCYADDVHIFQSWFSDPTSELRSQLDEAFATNFWIRIVFIQVWRPMSVGFQQSTSSSEHRRSSEEAGQSRNRNVRNQLQPTSPFKPEQRQHELNNALEGIRVCSENNGLELKL